MIATQAVTTIAGLVGSSGSSNGVGSDARFNLPQGIEYDGSGNLFICDTFNQTIRKLVIATGSVTTIAGLVGIYASADGVGSAARFSYPRGIVYDGNGNLFITDSYNITIRKLVIATGAVTTIAGLALEVGTADGVGSGARFNYPRGIAYDGKGNLFICDTSNHTIRKLVIATQAVTTIAGTAGSQGTADGVGSDARFYQPFGIAYDGNGNLYISDPNNRTIRKLVIATGAVTTIAGLAGSSGSADGVGSAARFGYPRGIVYDGNGNLYNPDNYTIRKIIL